MTLVAQVKSYMMIFTDLIFSQTLSHVAPSLVGLPSLHDMDLKLEQAVVQDGTTAIGAGVGLGGITIGAGVGLGGITIGVGVGGHNPMRSPPLVCSASGLVLEFTHWSQP